MKLPLFTLTSFIAFLTINLAAQEAKRDSPESNSSAKGSQESKTGTSGSAETRKTGDSSANTKEGRIFAAYDKDKDGLVTGEEIEAMRDGKLDSRQRKEIRDSLREYDLDKSKSLSLEEFANWTKRGTNRETGEKRSSETGEKRSSETGEKRSSETGEKRSSETGEKRSSETESGRGSKQPESKG
ncbi:MAG TPA: EF-hand domain-containing protein [Verrucomicrobiales bacterium]|nr:EF-hand domain-containing protein [Verrucomicrobiales bacterium]